MLPLRRLGTVIAIAVVLSAGCRSDGPGERPGWSDGSASVGASSDGPAQTMAPAARFDAPTRIWIRDFSVAKPAAGADDAGRPRLLPGLLRGMRSELSQSQLTGMLSSRVARDLVARGYAAERLTDAALPTSGWLVQGTFVEFVNPDGSFVSDRWAAQQVELTIVIDDLVRGTPRPLTDFTLRGDASGVGAPMAPNPYAAGAKFVVRQTELEGDASKLAARVADAIARFAQSAHVRPSPDR